MKTLAAGQILAFTLLIICNAAPSRGQSGELAEAMPPSPFGTPPGPSDGFSLGANPRLGALRGQSESFGFNFTAARIAADSQAWPPPSRSLFAASLTPAHNTFKFLSSSDFGRRKRFEPSWKPADGLAEFTGIPPVDKDRSHFGQAVARGALGFLMSRVVSELAGERGKSPVAVRSASDPHGKGVGLGLSASW